MSQKCKIAVIGTGVMGSGLSRVLAKHHNLSLCDKNLSSAQELALEIGAESFNKIEETVKEADVVLLAVKPDQLSDIAKELSSTIKPDQVIVSILAGVTQQDLKEKFSKGLLINMMPNVCCFQGEGVVAFADTGELSDEEKEELGIIFQPLGQLFWLPEKKFAPFTALAGSGPAFAFLIIESLVDAGVAMGLTAQEAKDIATGMFLGAIKTVQETGSHPGELKWQVTSPGGCTIAGVKTFEDESVRSGLINTVLSTYDHIKQQ